jgi:hypothetical protein
MRQNPYDFSRKLRIPSLGFFFIFQDRQDRSLEGGFSGRKYSPQGYSGFAAQLLRSQFSNLKGSFKWLLKLCLETRVRFADFLPRSPILSILSILIFIKKTFIAKMLKFTKGRPL